MKFVTDILPTLRQSYKGSNISLFFRKLVEQVPFRQLLGLQLTGLAFAGAILVPQLQDISTALTISQTGAETIVEVVPTESKLQWPMSRFGLSQRFSLSHPGVDLTAPKGTTVYSAGRGWVSQIIRSQAGFGNHVFVEHDDGVKTLYAHLSKINVKLGDTVSGQNPIGAVGSTGWSTGNHLHLEIYQNNVPVNPLEVLPEIREIKSK